MCVYWLYQVANARVNDIFSQQYVMRFRTKWKSSGYIQRDIYFIINIFVAKMIKSHIVNIYFETLHLLQLSKYFFFENICKEI